MPGTVRPSVRSPHATLMPPHLARAQELPRAAAKMIHRRYAQNTCTEHATCWGTASQHATRADYLRPQLITCVPEGNLVDKDNLAPKCVATQPARGMPNKVFQVSQKKLINIDSCTHLQ